MSHFAQRVPLYPQVRCSARGIDGHGWLRNASNEQGFSQEPLQVAMEHGVLFLVLLMRRRRSRSHSLPPSLALHSTEGRRTIPTGGGDVTALLRASAENRMLSGSVSRKAPV